MCSQCRRFGFKPGLGRPPLEENGAPVFFPGKCHGQRSLVGYSPWGHRRVGENLVTKQQHKHMLMSDKIDFKPKR